jgi:hypothetical protein
VLFGPETFGEGGDAPVRATSKSSRRNSTSMLYLAHCTAMGFVQAFAFVNYGEQLIISVLYSKIRIIGTEYKICF